MKASIKKVPEKNSANVKPELSSEDAVIASEIRYRRLFEAAKDGILILDAETGKIIDVNPYLIDLLGYWKEYFIEKEIWETRIFKGYSCQQRKIFRITAEGICPL